MSWLAGEGTLGSLSPETLIKNEELMNGFATYLENIYQVPVIPSQIHVEGKRNTRLVHSFDNNLKIKYSVDAAYRAGLWGAIKNYVEKVGNLPPVIVVKKIDGRNLYSKANFSEIVAHLPANADTTDLEKIYGELKQRPNDHTFLYEIGGSTFGNREMDPKSFRPVPIKDYMRLFSREELRFWKEPFFENAYEMMKR